MSRTLTGRGVLLWLTAFFGIIFATNAYFVTAAVKTFRGEDVEDPYLQGVEYNDTIARRAEQKKLGWSATIGVTRLASGHVRVDVTLARPDGSAASGAVLVGSLRHPANGNLDRPLHFRELAQGRYQAELSGVSSGSWDVMVNSPPKQAPFAAIRRVWVP